MSKEAKQRLSLVSVFLLLTLLGLLTFWSPLKDPKALAAPGNPIIDPALVAVYAPQTGQSVRLFVRDTAIQNANGTTQVRARNVTTDEWGTQVLHDEVKGTWISVTGAGGDIVELEADNGTGVDVEVIDFVPNPADIARPEFRENAVVPSLTGSTFTLSSVVAGAIQDESFPVVLEAYREATPGTVATQTLPNASTLINLTLLQVGGTDRVILQATDDYGNRSELHFRADGAVPARPSGLVFNASADQVDAERTGLAPRAGSGILLKGREFVSTVVIAGHRGAVLPVEVPITYRSGLVTTSGSEYDGPVGFGWDLGLNSRIVASGSSRTLYTGAGREETGFTSVSSHSWDSPPGIFSKLTYDKTVGEYTLLARNGSKWIYSGQGSRLVAQEDAYGNRIEYIRDGNGEVIEILDDRGRRTMLGWFDTGRLATVEDYTGRRTSLWYDTQGRLVRLDLPDGSIREWNYDATQTYLLTKVIDGGGRVALENIYGTSGSDLGRVVEQRDRASSGTTGWTFAAHVDGALVTDPLGAETLYGFDTQSSVCSLDFIESRSNLNLRVPTTGVWPNNEDDDPYTWRICFETNTQNLLLGTRYQEYQELAGSTPISDLERESWVYESPNHSDPRLRSRLQSHFLHGDIASAADDLKEEWLYTNPDDEWAETFNEFSNASTNALTRTFDVSGQLLTESRAAVNQAVGSTQYTIEMEYAYDSRGRLEKVWNANRLHDFGPSTATAPSIELSYYSSGLQEGWLSTREVNNAAGIALLTTSYAYDHLGRVVEQTEPNGAVWAWEYDALGRKTRELEPEVTLTDPQANGALVQGETQWVYATGSGDLTTVRTKLIESDGTSPTDPWVEQSFDYTASGLLLGAEAEIDANRSSRMEYRYNARGDVILEGNRIRTSPADAWAVVTSDYDERGQLLSRRQLIDEVSDLNSLTGTESALEDWYQYSLRKGTSWLRRDLHFGHQWETPEFTEFDAFGRKSAHETVEASIGKPFQVPNASEGKHRTEWTYGDEGWLVQEETFSADLTESPPPINWQTTSAKRYGYDEAGRKVRTWVARDSNGPLPPSDGSDWAATQLNLRPGGQVEKHYGPGDAANAVFAETQYDELDREVTRTNPHGDRELLAYTAPGGRLSATTMIPFDDLADARVLATDDYHTSNQYDELGRMVVRSEKGKDNGNAHFLTRTAYNSLGQAVRTEEQVGTSYPYSTTRVLRREYDWQGRKLSYVRGGANIDPPLTGVYEKVTWERDDLGRVESRQQHSHDPLESARVTSYTYDALGRRLTEELPTRGAGAPVRLNTYTYTYSAGELTEVMTDAVDVTISTVFNELGNPIEATASSTGTLSGNTLVEYYYGLSGGCGCAGTGNLSEIRTSGPGTDDTRVTRSYDYRGNLTNESITVGACSALVTTMKYDADNRRTELRYPTAGAFNGAYENQVYTDAGLLARIEWKPWAPPPGADYTTIMDYEYLGSGYQQIQTYYHTGVLQLTGTYSRDAHGRVDQQSWTKPATPVPELVVEQSFDWRADGLLEKRSQPTNTATQEWQHYTYEPGVQLACYP